MVMEGWGYFDALCGQIVMEGGKGNKEEQRGTELNKGESIGLAIQIKVPCQSAASGGKLKRWNPATAGFDFAQPAEGSRRLKPIRKQVPQIKRNNYFCI